MLNAPFQIGELAKSDDDAQNGNSIWMKQGNDDITLVSILRESLEFLQKSSLLALKIL